MDDETNWEDNVEECAKNFSRRMEQAFIEEMRRASVFIPNIAHMDGRDDRVFQVEAFVRYLIATTVTVACRYVNTEKDFEKNFLALTKSQFEQCRNTKETGIIL